MSEPRKVRMSCAMFERIIAQVSGGKGYVQWPDHPDEDGYYGVLVGTHEEPAKGRDKRDKVYRWVEP